MRDVESYSDRQKKDRTPAAASGMEIVESAPAQPAQPSQPVSLAAKAAAKRERKRERERKRYAANKEILNAKAKARYHDKKRLAEGNKGQPQEAIVPAAPQEAGSNMGNAPGEDKGKKAASGA